MWIASDSQVQRVSESWASQKQQTESINQEAESDKRLNMADLEAVLADVSYLMAMEKSKCTPAARASKKIVLPDPR